MKNHSGFTFIEILVSLVLISMIASVIGLWMVLGAQGYVFTRENSALAHKARVAMSRIGRELTGLSAVDSANSNDTCIRYKVGTISSRYRALGLNGMDLELKALAGTDCGCGTAGYVLVNNVADFDLSYEDKDETSPLLSTPPSDLGDLAAIHIELTLNRSDGTGTEKFEITINPRNNGNQNGPGVL